MLATSKLDRREVMAAAAGDFAFPWINFMHEVSPGKATSGRPRMTKNLRHPFFFTCRVSWRAAVDLRMPSFYVSKPGAVEL